MKLFDQESLLKGLREVRESIGAVSIKYTSTYNIKKNEISTTHIDKKVYNKEEIIKIIDKYEEGETFIDDDGNCRFVYIMDHTFSWTDRKKVHLNVCKAVKKILNDNKKRYNYTTNTSGEFKIFRKRDREEYVRLDVCKLCWDNMAAKHKQFQKKKFISDYGGIKDFDFAEYAKIFSEIFKNYNSSIKSTDTRSGSSYPPDWDSISKRFRAIKNWTCEGCGLDCNNKPGNLDTHHIDHDKNNNSSKNLKALCKECHKKEHDHM